MYHMMCQVAGRRKRLVKWGYIPLPSPNSFFFFFFFLLFFS